MRKLTRAAVLGATVAVAGIALLPTAANAAENVVQVPLAQGATGDLVWSFTNTGAAVNNLRDGSTIAFSAPTGTTFPGQTTVPSYFGTVGTGNAMHYTGCTVSNAGKTLTCDVNMNGLTNISWGTNGTFIATPKVTVAANAAPGAYTSSSATLNLTGSNGSITASAGLRVKVTMAAPQFSSVDNSGDTTVLKGSGTPGATIAVKDASGNTIGAATVGSDGSWSVDLGADFSNGSGDLTVTQSLNGETSPEATFAGADLPVINSAIAGGAGLATLLGAGAFLLRRRMA
ncbi:Ig-like domain-containing protein [Frondihabitans australicus]|uniref:Bacterial Ig domain-containing protein n=1 Tax=Frondihabitans australicus TaxID=386892 RepID=A0A495IK28_9MICO|nr:Ig-like domain-containing protein [Frondihabitans australicus]RKR75778.1 hypothetical protein C8E83_2934 [Frondihabitans australicus]